MIWIFLSLLALTIVVGVSIARVNKVKDKTVCQHSRRIKQLSELNASTMFYFGETFFQVERFFDNKSNYNRIEPGYIMASVLREELDFYADLIQKLRDNRQKYEDYLEKAYAPTEPITAEECEELHCSLKDFLLREKKLFDKQVLYPPLDCTLNVSMRYSSRKGQVQLSKSGSFNLDDMFSCLESVSRSRVDKGTYAKLSAVERGALSDSLRYDILRRDDFKCAICGASAQTGVRLHVDHIVPIAKGGKTVPSNLRVLCERCNIGKSDKIETKSDNELKEIQSDNQIKMLQEIPSNQICPRCGGELVKRTGKYGEFYGCKNYPRCKFTAQINPDQ